MDAMLNREIASDFDAAQRELRFAVMLTRIIHRKDAEPAEKIIQ
jgi:hypothetical protein